MEIIIKTKQTKNTQFNFLHFEDPLSNYYKHMVKMIKSGKYKPKDIKEEDNDKGKFEYLLHVKFTYEAKKKGGGFIRGMAFGGSGFIRGGLLYYILILQIIHVIEI